ncbi:glutamate 5-kinase [Pullulanibacillus sp. KACC 23026]|uniref:glutamate 5-kinase n=1 Tax=Pullulanibacillus sp. KACC 23026 TaxID=3028315 RepID=UPI0023B1665B|nr:glutamate 5-kinase [Pullulanibacillus sp. KACC 23026]WEG13174.1 glutamate 5-kinase [Pullulanibacillus sp. KACC 23026]
MGRQRIVVKIGSSSLTDEHGQLSESKLTEHVAALSALRKAGHELLLITSGAVAAGFSALGYPSRPVTISGKQAAAAVGQSLLMQHYSDQFRSHGLLTAQLLLTRHDFSIQDQYTNAFNTLSELLRRGVVPIINENDSVAIEELTFGDNDRLSALVSGLVHADWLIILTDINGLYSKDPRKSAAAERLSFLPEITEKELALAGDAVSKVGTGGMRSKIEASKTALHLGVPSFIGTGSGPEKLLKVLEGKGDGTYVGSSPHALPLKNKKQWIQLHSEVSGQVVVDNGAADALLDKGKSLLPAGVVEVRGHFHEGQVVEVLTHAGQLIGKGQVTLSAEDLKRIKGKHSQAIKHHSPHHRPEVIHRDHWVPTQ